MKYLKLQARWDTTIPSSVDQSAATNSATNGTDTGTNAINSFDPTTTAGSQQTSLGSSGLEALTAPETNSITNQYAAAVANNPTVTSLYQTGNNLYNVPQLATEATNLTNQVNNLTPNAYQASKGYDIDSTDIANGIANSNAYLTPQQNAATANYNTAAGLAANYVNAGQLQNAQNLLPVQNEATLVAQQEAAQQTGWNQTLSDQFNGLIDKMQNGVTLSANEMSLAQNLASQEEQYQQAVATAEIPLSAQDVKSGDTLVNNLTNTMTRPTTLTNATGYYKGA